MPLLLCGYAGSKYGSCGLAELIECKLVIERLQNLGLIPDAIA